MATEMGKQPNDRTPKRQTRKHVYPKQRRVKPNRDPISRRWGLSTQQVLEFFHGDQRLATGSTATPKQPVLVGAPCQRSFAQVSKCLQGFGSNDGSSGPQTRCSSQLGTTDGHDNLRAWEIHVGVGMLPFCVGTGSSLRHLLLINMSHCKTTPQYFLEKHARLIIKKLKWPDATTKPHSRNT